MRIIRFIRNFRVSDWKKYVSFSWAGRFGKILGILVTLFILIFVFINKDLYLNSDLTLAQGRILFGLSMLCAPACGLFIAVKASVCDRLKAPVNTLFFFLLPVATIQMSEVFNGNYIYNFSVPTFFLNYGLMLSIYLLFFVITGRYHAVGLIVNISILVWSILNYFIQLFRGSPFVPMDILSFSTGLSVADNYVYELSWNLIMGCILFLMIYLLNRHIRNVRCTKKCKALVRIIPAGAVIAFLFTFFCTDVITNAGYKPDFWNQTRGYKNTGSFFNFCLNAKYLYVSKPDGYNADSTEEILRTVLESVGVDPDSNKSTNMLTGNNDYSSTAEETKPNLICIMNESLADLRIFGDLQTNEEMMPFLDSMSENTIKGYLYMPVYGAGTSNSEFEFLSGNSMYNLPAGSNAYAAYIDDVQATLVTTLKSQGYSAHAFHPYYKDGWDRPEVYRLFGFETYTAIEDFIDNDILNEYIETNNAENYQARLKEAYPDEDILLRRFVSDSYDYKLVKEMYEERNEDQPFFLFNVTMQNHGGYGVSYSNFEQEIFATNLDGYYPMANRYMSLVKASDTAFQELVEYFQEVEEPTIICMFGDHLPSIETEFYEELLGTELESLTNEQEQLRYMTPFVIWANYDIPEATIEKISSNYLSTLLLQVAGLELSEYNKFLAAMYQTLPVVNAVGYIDNEDNYYSAGEESEHTELLNLYKCIQYNNMFDIKNKQNQLFYLNEFEIQMSEISEDDILPAYKLYGE